mmetsp:Transcript_11000/g.41070  ORF Transcript_11000/g.41070 Transcript_11000/m.41070 type:complete len:1313 (-) Transcript_11000:885-4823(-)
MLSTVASEWSRRFPQFKALALSKLAEQDKSPKGSLDAPIADFVHFLNAQSDFVTTSSCSGRICVFEENSATPNDSSKGRGNWALVEHRQVEPEEVLRVLQKAGSDDVSSLRATLRHEPMILHVQCRTFASANKLLKLAISQGFRESGMVPSAARNLVAIRTTSDIIAAPVILSGCRVPDDAVVAMVCLCNAAFERNAKRTQELFRAAREAFAPAFCDVVKPRQLAFSGRDAPGSFRRWGHVAERVRLASGEDAVLVVGGFGEVPSTASGADPSRRRRGDVLLWRPASGRWELLDMSDSLPLREQAAGCRLRRLEELTGPRQTSTQLFLYCCGRNSPQDASHDFFVLDLERKGITCAQHAELDIEGAQVRSVESPIASRWALAVASIRPVESLLRSCKVPTDSCEGAFLLYGGRDGTTVFCDAFVGHVLKDSGGDSFSIAWTRLNLGGEQLSKRFLHAACGSADGKAVFVSGGLSSTSPVVKPVSSLIQIDVAACVDRLGQAPQGPAVVEVSPRITKSLEAEPVSDAEVAVLQFHDSRHSVASTSIFNRFGHTMTPLDAADQGRTSLLICGGCFDPDQEGGGAVPSIAVLDVSNLEGKDGAVVDCVTGRVRLPPEALDSPWAACDLSLFSSGACVQLHADGETHVVGLLGGGQQTFAFGPVFSPTAYLSITVSEEREGKEPAQDLNSSAALPRPLLNGGGSADEKRLEKDSRLALGSMRHDRSAERSASKGFTVLVSPAAATKSMKTCLERLDLLQKSRRIHPFHGSVAKEFGLRLEGSEGEAKLLALPISARTSEILADLPSVQASEGVREAEGVAGEALSVRERKRRQQHEARNLSPAVAVATLKAALESQSCVILKYSSEQASDGAMETPMSSSNERSANRRALNSANRTISTYLQSEGVVPSSFEALLAKERDLFPGRFEVLGRDVLLLQPHTFSGPVWSALFAMAGRAQRLQQAVLSAIAQALDCSRVALAAAVDPGPKRESRVRLIIPTQGDARGEDSLDEKLKLSYGVSPDGFLLREDRADSVAAIRERPESASEASALLLEGWIPKRTGTGGLGWVEVREGGVTYGFDFTRVMFCSGNVTERMRMGRVEAAGETVVDLYAGIGYYTIPFSLHAGAEVVHACEWNPNSLLALRNNVLVNGLSDECVIIHPGDNRRTVLGGFVDKALTESADDGMAPRPKDRGLLGIADRVCLGLLPSSETGLDLGAWALKATGGWLHVHENVREDEVDDWIAALKKRVESLLLEKEALLRQQGLAGGEEGSGAKRWTIECPHVERVKSYAPRVYHFVADVFCRCRANSDGAPLAPA